MTTPKTPVPEPADESGEGPRIPPVQAVPPEDTSLATQRMPILQEEGVAEPPRPGTQPMLVAATALQNLEPPAGNVQTQAMPIPSWVPEDTRPFVAEPTLQMPQVARRRRGVWAASLGLLALCSAGLLYAFWDATPPPAPIATQMPRPPVLQPYLARAEAGDTQAMRMLGTRYYYGLDVPRNREEGRRWFEKAVRAGDRTAQAELAQLGP